MAHCDINYLVLSLLLTTPFSIYSNPTCSQYYFAFGNMDCIWAQQDRHWNKNRGFSLKDDKGCEPFEPKDELNNCKWRVGENKRSAG